MKKLAVLLLTILMLNACVATGPAFQELAEPISDKAVVYIFRQSKFAGSGNSPELIIDKKTIGSLPNGGYFETILDAGNHRLEIQFGSPTHIANIGRSISVEVGRLYFYEYVQSPYLPNLDIHPRDTQEIQELPVEDALPILKGMRQP
tara:strand:+ start:218 stop:661 length:444 start_codon:yes stop_codon:yes gene_type:complete